MRFMPIALSAALGMVGAPAAAQTATVPYENDFSGVVGAEWDRNTTDDLPDVGVFLGPFGPSRHGLDEQLTLRAEMDAATEYALIFDLYIFDDWEGLLYANSDEFVIYVEGIEAFRQTFSCGDYSETLDQSVLYVERFENIGYGAATDIVLRDVTVRFIPTGGINDIRFQPNMRDDANEERWGLDNVRLVVASTLEEVELPLSVNWIAGQAMGASVEGLDFDDPTVRTEARQIAWLSTPSWLHPDYGGDDIAWQITGGLNIPEPGTWNFRLTSDDGSTMRLDGAILIDNDGAHAPTAVTASIDLETGTHPLDVRAFEATGGAMLMLEWWGPSDSAWSIIPPWAFERERRRIVRWRGTNQEETLRAALAAEVIGRGFREDLDALRDTGHDTIPNMLLIIGCEDLREALGEDAAVLRDLASHPDAD